MLDSVTSFLSDLPHGGGLKESNSGFVVQFIWTLKGTFRGIVCGGGDCDRLKLAPQTYLWLAALQ